MKRVVHRDDLDLAGIDLVGMRPHHLERAFDRFRAGIAEKRSLQAAQLGQLFSQRALILVIVEIGAMDELRRLLADQFHDARMSVSKRVHADAGDEIEVTLAVEIVDIGPLPAAQN